MKNGKETRGKSYYSREAELIEICDRLDDVIFRCGAHQPPAWWPHPKTAISAIGYFTDFAKEGEPLFKGIFPQIHTYTEGAGENDFLSAQFRNQLQGLLRGANHVVV